MKTLLTISALVASRMIFTTAQEVVLSLDACTKCCDAVLDLNFFVGAQKSSSCRDGGCRDLDCGSGFACNVGLNFRIGEQSGIQKDGNGNEVGYVCSEDGTVTQYLPPTAFPTFFPTTPIPTAFPTTSVPTEKPTPQPTTSSPTKQPTPLPTTPEPTATGETPSPTSRPTTRPPTAQPTTKSPTAQPTTKSPTGTRSPTTHSPTTNSTADYVPRITPEESKFFDSQTNVIAVSGFSLLFIFVVAVLLYIRDDRKNGISKRNRLNSKDFKYNKDRERLYTDDFNKSNFHVSVKGPWTKKKNLFSSNVEIEQIKKERASEGRGSMPIAPPPRMSELDNHSVHSSGHASFKQHDDLKDDDVWEYREKSMEGSDLMGKYSASSRNSDATSV